MKQDEILGEDYNITFGAILNYRKLAEYIINLNLFKNDSGFIDLACGTGNLIHELQKLNYSLKLVGIDIDDNQIQIAKKNKHVRFLNDNLFSFNTRKLDPTVKWIAHLGFAFLNRVPIDEVQMFFENLYKNLNIRHIICELWDYDYQLQNYKYGQWYRTNLNNGHLLTRSLKYKANDDNAIKIDFDFVLPNKRISTNYIMFRHKTDELKNVIIKSKWECISFSKALYRENIDSHKVLIASREPAVNISYNLVL